MDEHQTNSSETCVEPLPAPLSEFCKSLSSTEGVIVIVIVIELN